MNEYQIVCIDDDEEFLSSLETSLPDRVAPLCDRFKCRFEFVSNPEELLRIMSGARSAMPAMVIADQVMPGVTGIELIERLKNSHPDLVCVLLTGHAGMDSAKYAINRHLLDQYISKPIEDLQVFALLVANLLKQHHLGLEERERTAQLTQTVESLRISNDKIRAMHAASEQVAMLSKNLKALDFDEVAELIAHEVPKLFDADWSVLCFPGGQCAAEARYHHGCPMPSADLSARRDTRNAMERAEVRCGDAAEVCVKLGARSPELIIPLNASSLPADAGEAGNAYLCMCQIAPGAAPSDLMEYKARLVGEILSANLTSARLYQKARQESRTDSLTGVSSRRLFEEKLETEYERATRYGRGFCVAIIDVDCFKGVNDTYGHPEGDRILIELAGMLRQVARSTDVVARYGGDEFVVLMPETTLDKAVAAAQRIRTQVASILTRNDSPLTISCGVAEWSASGANGPSDVLRRADAALYEAKHAGRNRVVVAKAA